MSLTKRRGVLVFPEIRSCVKVEVDVLGSPSLIARSVSVSVLKQHQVEQIVFLFD